VTHTSLLAPRLLGLRNTWTRAGQRQRFAYGFFALLTLAFWIAMFGVSIYLLHRIYSVEVFGPVLAEKLLGMLTLSLLVMLTFSSLISGIASFFLAEDLDLLLHLPIRWPRLHYARLLESTMASSWMVLIFGLPILLAYGIVLGGGALYYLLVLVVLLSLTIMPSSVGAVAAAVLVNLFPARRVREGLMIAGLGAALVLFFLVRSARPELLVDAERFATIADFFGAIRSPESILLPSTWASRVLLWGLGEPVADPLLALGLLVSGTVATAGLARWAIGPLYTSGRTRSQEAAAPRFARNRLLERALVGGMSRFPPVLRAMMIKDVRTFFRDAGQWTQVLMIAALVFIYLYNVYALPLDQNPFPTFRLENLVGFFNVGVTGFVLAALSVRFNYPAVSAEGRAFWILKASPIGAERFLHAKFLWGIVPMLVMGELLVITSNLLLHVDWAFMALSVYTVAVLAVGVTGLGVGIGAIYPNFRADSATRIASGPGAILYMVVTSLFIAATILIEGVPASWSLAARFQGLPLTASMVAATAAGMVAATALNLLAVRWVIRRGAQVLWNESW
jgi:ABC-2 type transport system permease protein